MVSKLQYIDQIDLLCTNEFRSADSCKMTMNVVMSSLLLLLYHNLLLESHAQQLQCPHDTYYLYNQRCDAASATPTLTSKVYSDLLNRGYTEFEYTNYAQTNSLLTQLYSTVDKFWIEYGSQRELIDLLNHYSAVYNDRYQSINVDPSGFYRVGANNGYLKSILVSKEYIAYLKKQMRPLHSYHYTRLLIAQSLKVFTHVEAEIQQWLPHFYDIHSSIRDIIYSNRSQPTLMLKLISQHNCAQTAHIDRSAISFTLHNDESNQHINESLRIASPGNECNKSLYERPQHNHIMEPGAVAIVGQGLNDVAELSATAHTVDIPSGVDVRHSTVLFVRVPYTNYNHAALKELCSNM